jgi:phage FluMu protein Com
MRLSCGNCGEHFFKLYEQNYSVMVKCIQCKAITEIYVVIPKLQIGWPTSIPSQGILCKMPNESNTLLNDIDDNL